MGTESHGSQIVSFDPCSTVFSGIFLIPLVLKDSRATECDIVKVADGEAQFLSACIASR
jgi:hypothetical protein